MAILKNFLIAVLPFSLFQGPILQAAEAVCTKRELFLTHTLLKTKRTQDNQLFYYRLHLASTKKLAGKKLKMVVINSFGQPTGHADIWFDQEEKVWISEGGQNLPLEEFEPTIGNFSDGEFVDFIVVDEEKHILAGTRLCPKPIECTASDGAILSLQLLSPGQYAIRGYGFKPNETFSLISQSEEEVIPSIPLEACAGGTLTAFTSPYVVGKSYGRASITLIRQDGTELKCSYLWGIPAEKLAAMANKKQKREV